MNKTVLIITDEYPPDKSGRSEKIWRRVYYLTQDGWNINILAPVSAAAPEHMTPETVNGQIVTVYRTGYMFQNQWPSLKHQKDRPIQTTGKNSWAKLLDFLFVPKGYVRWLPYAVARGHELARSADVILSVSNPIGLHLVAMGLKRLTRTPWIAEFRDALVNYQYSSRGPEQINRRIERLIVANADVILQWDDAIAEPISERYPPKFAHKFRRLFPIGYDPIKFQNYPPGYHSDPSSPLKISYTGLFHGDAIVPIYFLEGLSRIIHEQQLLPSQIQVRFAGSWLSKYDHLLKELGLTEFVSYCGWLSHEECVDLWQDSDVLLMILGETETETGILPTKLWDYIASQRYIFCLAPPTCRTADYIRRMNIGIISAPKDIDDIAVAIKRLLAERYPNNLGFQPDEDMIASVSCINMEQEIAQILDATAVPA